jgi:hypothetical protein
MKYCQVFISAEIRSQGIHILKHLLSKRLAFGGPVFSGPAVFPRLKIHQFEYDTILNNQ